MGVKEINRISSLIVIICWVVIVFSNIHPFNKASLISILALLQIILDRIHIDILCWD